MKSPLAILEDYFLKAYQEGKNIYVEMTFPDLKENEIIIDRCDSIPQKIDYYKKNFTEDLISKENRQIEIISFGTINSSNMPKGL